MRPVFKNQIWSGTLGDTITMQNLTVQLGVRYDRQQAKNLPGPTFENTRVLRTCFPAASYHGSPNWQFDFTNWQPRVSATYSLGQNKSTLLRASYAQFADQLGFIGYYGSGVPISNGYYYYWTDINHDHFVQRNEIDLENGFYGFYNDIDPAVLPSNPNIIDPNLKTPKTNEVTVGADHQFTDTFAVSATFSYRSTTSLLENIPNGFQWRDVGARGSDSLSLESGRRQTLRGFLAPQRRSNGFTLSFDEPFYSLTLADEPAGVTVKNRPQATQKYYGVDVSVVKRLSDHWIFRGNFGWNSFKQHLQVASIEDPNNLWGGTNCGSIAARARAPRPASPPRTSVFINANWQFNVNALYQGPWGINLGVNFFGRQGYPNPYLRPRARR